ncbi:MAG TPA: hypothetical protein VI386_20825 [Candidatus Sulfotelmatobacter sp.]
MAIKDKIKSAFEWLEHGKTLVELVLALGGGATVRALLHQFTKIPGIWITPIWLLSSAVFLWLLLKALGHASRTQSTAQSTATSTALVSAATFDATEHFKHSYVSTFTAEVEKNIRIAANQNQPNDREGFFARFIGLGLVSYMHDITWAYIYKSQLLMLLELNRRGGWLPLSDVKGYYDRAAIDSPNLYSDYSFGQWQAFIKSQDLLIQHPSDMFEITVRGEDFLKYLTHWGRYADARSG